MGNIKMIVVFPKKIGVKRYKISKTGGLPSLLVVLKTHPKGQQPRFPGEKKQ